jgi:hypothetical protein
MALTCNPCIDQQMLHFVKPRKLDTNIIALFADEASLKTSLGLLEAIA